MEPDVETLPPPNDELVRWLEQMADGDDDFPGTGGIVAYRMRRRAERAERAERFRAMRGTIHMQLRPEAKAA